MSYYGGAVDITGEIQLDKLNDINSEHYRKIKEKYTMVGDFVVNKSFKQNWKLYLSVSASGTLCRLGFTFKGHNQILQLFNGYPAVLGPSCRSFIVGNGF